jgi:hypothetical protein
MYEYIWPICVYVCVYVHVVSRVVSAFMESEGTPHFTNTFFKKLFNIIFSAKPKYLLCYEELVITSHPKSAKSTPFPHTLTYFSKILFNI